MDRQEEISQILNAANDVTATLNSVESLSRAYPFFSLPSAIMIKHFNGELADDVKQRLLHRIALSSPDPTTLYQLLNTDGDSIHNFYPKEEKKPQIGTEDTITTFLNTYGNSEPGEEELLEKLIFNPVPDYASVLESEEDEDKTENKEKPTGNDALIDAFLEKQKPEKRNSSSHTTATVKTKPNTESEPSKPDPDSMLSESLAKIYIKQRRYDKAYEIISQLSLNFPKKSIYFADQLRFLRKLIINQQHKNSKNN